MVTRRDRTRSSAKPPAMAPATRRRCDAIVVQLILTEYDGHDRPVGEEISQPLKMFRAKSLDFWRTIDESVERAISKAPPSRPAVPPAEKVPQ